MNQNKTTTKKQFPKTNGKKNIKLDMEELDMGRINDIQVIDDIYALKNGERLTQIYSTLIISLYENTDN